MKVILFLKFPFFLHCLGLLPVFTTYKSILNWGEKHSVTCKEVIFFSFLSPAETHTISVLPSNNLNRISASTAKWPSDVLCTKIKTVCHKSANAVKWQLSRLKLLQAYRNFSGLLEPKIIRGHGWDEERSPPTVLRNRRLHSSIFKSSPHHCQFKRRHLKLCSVWYFSQNPIQKPVL